ncbi:hypothetical protein [Streptomyces sp. NPDC020681]|uniref:hypothetical protein n=1 Tax=Streptomyces sp. NPDC020681 TaxID=3365083 RepID=UPI003791EB2B
MMRRPDHGTLRTAGFTSLLIVVFLTVNTTVAHAATTTSESGGLLAPLNINSSEGAPIDGYELSADGGSIVSFTSQALAFVLSGLFTVVRLLVGLSCWAVEVAFRFPLLKVLAAPAQKVSDAYSHAVVDTLGLKGLLLAWAFVFGLIMFVRGKVGRGLGEIVLTLMIAALAASAFVRPDYLLSHQGPLAQTQQAAAEVAQQTVNSYDWGGKIYSGGPCSGMAGREEAKCLATQGAKPVSAAEVARPIQDAVTNALIVKPYMLLQYGQILDPGKPADRKAYDLHLKWISGGYQADKTQREDKCRLIVGHARKYCRDSEAEKNRRNSEDDLPALTPGDALLETASPLLSEQDQQFAAFLNELKDAGPVGKACADYAKKPTWWRAGGAALLLLAAVLICAMLLAAAIVLLGTQAADAAAAAAGVLTFVWGMLPGPSRQVVWKWLALFGISMLSMTGVCLFLPFFGIAVDAILTNGPDLMVERLLLLDVLALAGLAFHRRLLAGITSFGQRTALRMRYMKVGGTHLPGDTSDLGAALALNGIGGGHGFGFGGGLRALGSHGHLGTRQRLMGHLAALADSAGMPLDTRRMLTDASAEATRGLAPLAIAATGARLGVQGAYGLLIGRRPGDDVLARLRKPTAGDGPDDDGNGPAGSGVSPDGPPDRYRDEQGRIVNRTTGDVLHDQYSDRTLLSTRAHNRLVRLRGYRLLHQGGRLAYGSTYGLPRSLSNGRARTSRYTQDTRKQLRVWGNTVREDGRAWRSNPDTHMAARLVREPRDNRNDGGGGPFAPRRLPTPTRPATHQATRIPPPPAHAPAVPSPLTTPAAAGEASSIAPPVRPGPPDRAELRRRVIDRLGAGDPPEERRRVLDAYEEREETRRRVREALEWDDGSDGDGS